MAHTVSYSHQLKLICLFDDNDTRTLYLDNPKSNLQASDIKDIESDMVTNQPIIGDKYGARFSKFNKAYIVNKTIYNLDLG